MRAETIAQARQLVEQGRVDDAAGLLGNALQADPDYPPYLAYLAIALHRAGHPRQALGTMLHCALAASRPGAFDGCEEALGEVHRELLET